MLKKDKAKVVGENLDEAKVRRFLEMQPASDENADFHILTKAYRGLPAEAFDRFLELYLAEGRQINPLGANGQRFLDSIRSNVAHPEYVTILERHGAS